MNKNKVKSAIETILFVWGDTISAKEIGEALNMPWKEVYDILIEMSREYEEAERGILIRRVDKSFQLVSRQENFSYVEKMVRPTKNKKLSQSALEVLAIIAYKQPITRADVDAIRGVKSDKVIEGLCNKGFVFEKGRSNGIGRPILYATTEKFLKYMNLEDIKSLPDLEIFGDEYESLSQWEKNQLSFDELSEEEAIEEGLSE